MHLKQKPAEALAAAPAASEGFIIKNKEGIILFGDKEKDINDSKEILVQFLIMKEFSIKEYFSLFAEINVHTIPNFCKIFYGIIEFFNSRYNNVGFYNKTLLDEIYNPNNYVRFYPGVFDNDIFCLKYMDKFKSMLKNVDDYKKLFMLFQIHYDDLSTEERDGFIDYLKKIIDPVSPSLITEHRGGRISKRYKIMYSYSNHVRRNNNLIDYLG